MYLSLIIIASGLIFAHRIAREYVDHQQLIAKSTLTKIGTAYFALIMFAILFLRSHATLWLAVFTPHVMFVLAMFSLRTLRFMAFRETFAATLTRLILKMKSGRGFREAYSDVIAESAPQMREKLSEIRDLVVFSQQHAPSTSIFVAQVIREFRIVDQQPHAALKRLQTLRERIQCENEFRRKSGQVLKQIRAQSILLSGLYVAVLIFVCRQFGAVHNARLILASLALFISGLAWIWLGGRSWKWKV